MRDGQRRGYLYLYPWRRTDDEIGGVRDDSVQLSLLGNCLRYSLQCADRSINTAEISLHNVSYFRVYYP